MSKDPTTFLMLFKTTHTSREYSKNCCTFHKTVNMYDNAELELTLSERACRVWVPQTIHSSGSDGGQPRLKDVQQGRRKVSVLVLTEELQEKIQIALALGCAYKRSQKSVKRWKHEILVEQADNNGTIESIKHRWNIKRTEIRPDKEPTEWQKKTLEKLARDLERLKLNGRILDGKIAALDKDLAHTLNRWREAWTDVHKILVEVWRNAGQLRSDEDSSVSDERPVNEVSSNSKAKDKKAHSDRNGAEDTSIVLSESDRAAQRVSERRQNEVSDWRRSVESSVHESMADAQSPGHRQSTERVRLHNNQSTRRRHQGEGGNGIPDHPGDPASSIRDQRSGPQPSASREHRADYNSRQAHDDNRVDRREDEQPSSIISQHSSMLPPPSTEGRHSPTPSGGVHNGIVRSNTHQERRRDGRSRSPRRDRLPSRETRSYRDRESHEKKRSRACDESCRARERSH